MRYSAPRPAILSRDWQRIRQISVVHLYSVNVASIRALFLRNASGEKQNHKFLPCLRPCIRPRNGFQRVTGIGQGQFSMSMSRERWRALLWAHCTTLTRPLQPNHR
ncbi:uncharacterized protein LOC143428041 [Xylocopa sonorina]|uniref:uncharacterized protein LOC143428041 n=1 Tax=Xylocopa sonorina TaxID=1818115 RepID=UPI00403A7DA0